MFLCLVVGAGSAIGSIVILAVKYTGDGYTGNNLQPGIAVVVQNIMILIRYPNPENIHKLKSMLFFFPQFVVPVGPEGAVRERLVSSMKCANIYIETYWCVQTLFLLAFLHQEKGWLELDIDREHRQQPTERAWEVDAKRLLQDE